MPIPSIYINLEDDVSKIVTRLKKTSAKEVVLVCPKRCYLFNDSINLRLLKKQTDMLGKTVSVLTMDEKGQLFAKEAGFQLKFLPKTSGVRSFSDVRRAEKQESEQQGGVLAEAVNEIKHIAEKFIPKAHLEISEETLENKTVKKKTRPVPTLQINENIFPSQEEWRPVKIKTPRINKTLTGVVALSLIVLLLLVFVILPKATVDVYAKTEPVTRDMEISMSTNSQNLDPSKLIMPAIKIDETANLNAKFQSKGKKQVGNKASGSVRIYNFTGSPINLKAQTTTLTVGNKTYTLDEDITLLKPTTYKNAATKEVNEGSLGPAVRITASAGGEDYNLPAGTRVEITNQVFGSRPQLLYAKTDSEISGGTTRYLSIISQEDVDASKIQLEGQALEQIRQKLKTSGLVLPEKSYNFDSPQFATDNPVGTETPSFQASLQSKLTGLAYKSDDLKNLIVQRITQTLSSNKSLVPKTPESTTVKVKSFDLNNQLAVLAVHFEGQAVYEVNLAGVATELTGKSQNEANEILRSKAEIDKVEITIAPAWQKNFPLFAGKIKINIVSKAQ